MHPDVPDPDYLPKDARVWAREHRELLEMIVEELLQTGAWPSVKALTRKLARGNQPVALSRVLGRMPKPLGFADHYPDRVVLLVFGLRMTHAGHKLLAGLLATLRLAAERYAGEEEQPSITRDDAARGTVLEDPYVRALSEILLREAPFLGSGSGGPEEHWSREITDDIVRYWDARTAEDYLRVRAKELSGSPQLGWQPVLLDPPTGATPAGPLLPLRGPRRVEPLLPRDSERAEVRDAFVSHAGEDEEIARALAAALEGRGHSVWYDEAELCVGDSLTEEIDRGLATSRFGVVILSRAFFAKRWPRRELEAFVARETVSGARAVLPVWHEIDEHYLVETAPLLADVLAANTNEGIDSIADQISRAICRRPPGPIGPLDAEAPTHGAQVEPRAPDR